MGSTKPAHTKAEVLLMGKKEEKFTVELVVCVQIGPNSKFFAN